MRGCVVSCRYSNCKYFAIGEDEVLVVSLNEPLSADADMEVTEKEISDLVSSNPSYPLCFPFQWSFY